MFNFLVKLFGTKSERDIRKLRPTADRTKGYEPEISQLSDSELKGKTQEFKERLREGETVEDILPEAFAVVKDTCRRLLGKTWIVRGQEITWDMVPFDCQLMGGIVLHQGKIAEMATGEGKTLVATLPIYLNALTGKGAHLITVNDYLAQRDREWMGPIYEFLGLTVGCIHTQMRTEDRKAQYECDVTYGTNSEFGFDYLRDNMAIRKEDLVQRGHHYAIVDEVDSVLIDEARTPLIISGPVAQSTEKYNELKPIIQQLSKRQEILANKLVSDAERVLEEEDSDTYAAGELLLQVQKGAPKNKRFLKLMENPRNQKLVRKVELDYIRDKRIHELTEELFFVIDEKTNVVDLTEKGRDSISPRQRDLFVVPMVDDELDKVAADTSLSEYDKEVRKQQLFDEANQANERLQSISQLLRAYSLYERDVEYVVTDNKVVIVDEFTGRLMPSRRFSDGLHQALEAKEGVKVGAANQTLATITLQNYYRMYEKLAGMTGTADTEAAEFHQIYKLDVVVVPTNRPLIRTGYPDVVFKSEREKFKAVVQEIEELHKIGRPVLVGTVTIDNSEQLSKMLKRKKIPHHVLNAKYHQKEAEIITQAGQRSGVTIATNMAGRGTDIKLGEGIADMAGLHVLGTERHESRRIDNQLRGRAGRQGDPGSSRFYLSLEDDLMRLFGSDRISRIMERLGMEEDQPIEHRLVTKSIETAQRRVEAHNLEIRKHLLEYDDVMNQQREVIYEQRRQILEGEDLKESVLGMIEDLLDEVFPLYVDEDAHPEDWDQDGLRLWFERFFGFDLQPGDIDHATITAGEIRERLLNQVHEVYNQKESFLGEEDMRRLEQAVMLQAVDSKWKDHLYSMDLLREGIGLRAVGQMDPLVEYKQEAYNVFTEMVDTIKKEVVETIFKLRIVQPEWQYETAMAGAQRQVASFDPSISAFSDAGQPLPEEPQEPQVTAPIRVGEKIGRNQPCPCGSGKKYKKCCGA